MRVAATLLFEQQAGVVADKEEKISKFRQSTAEAAARVIQQMYFIFSVSKLRDVGGNLTYPGIKFSKKTRKT